MDVTARFAEVAAVAASEHRYRRGTRIRPILVDGHAAALPDHPGWHGHEPKIVLLLPMIDRYFIAPTVQYRHHGQTLST
ncbi:hypothetical protein BZL30_7957 [Mycobacterium kansasii]|uniref:Uncharacterized protein n=1 Tax=Mycobacterium kansasii TaxID=1768 RepID=A0A1V3XYB6_MYCKA|nr:hypothetical protein BZL30_7957 [Mycobacterium kansasii]OOK84048.1 hypothetical protein BZL29_0026 [Mycobacterium kansasii]